MSLKEGCCAILGVCLPANRIPDYVQYNCGCHRRLERFLTAQKSVDPQAFLSPTQSSLPAQNNGAALSSCFRQHRSAARARRPARYVAGPRLIGRGPLAVESQQVGARAMSRIFNGHSGAVVDARIWRPMQHQARFQARIATPFSFVYGSWSIPLFREFPGA